jgi:hypothetical protein
VDGLLDEAIWDELKPIPLVPVKAGAGTGAGTVRIFRSVSSVAIGFKLKKAAARRWEVTIALDADRDAWSQLVLKFDNTGEKSAHIAFRLGPWIRLSPRAFLLQGRQDDEKWETFEAAIPLAGFGDPLSGFKFNFQIHAQSVGPDGRQGHCLAGAYDRRLLPEIYPMLEIAPAKKVPEKVNKQ